MRTPRPSLLVLLPVLASGALTAPAFTQAASSTQCQKPVTTGVGVTDRKHVSARRACDVALHLYRWEFREGNERRLFRCKDFKPILVRRSFAGWRLKVVKTYELRLQRGTASFITGGTDFPLNCS